MTDARKVLVIDDLHSRQICAHLNKLPQIEAIPATNVADAESHLTQQWVDIIVLDAWLPERKDDRERCFGAARVIAYLRNRTSHRSIEEKCVNLQMPAVVVISGERDSTHAVKTIVDWLDQGVVAAAIPKAAQGCGRDLFLGVLAHTIKGLREDLVLPPRPVEAKDVLRAAGIVWASDDMLAIGDKIRQVANTNVSVLISGDTGVGKELVARAIHIASGRSGVFAAEACGRFNGDETSAMSAIFGHKIGAYTGAASDRIGLIRLANYGTAFLDELQDLPLSVQTLLIRVLDDRYVVPLGADPPGEHVNFRIVCATNRRVEELVDEGTLRKDLYYRMCQFAIHVPPLRDRTCDIPALAAFFTNKHADEFKKQPLTIDASGLELLATYSWPGNVRELSATILMAVMNDDDGVLTDCDFDEKFRKQCLQPANGSSCKPMKRDERDQVARIIEPTLNDLEGNEMRKRYMTEFRDWLNRRGQNSIKPREVHFLYLLHVLWGRRPETMTLSEFLEHSATELDKQLKPTTMNNVIYNLEGIGGGGRESAVPLKDEDGNNLGAAPHIFDIKHPKGNKEGKVVLGLAEGFLQGATSNG